MKVIEKVSRALLDGNDVTICDDVRATRKNLVEQTALPNREVSHVLSEPHDAVPSLVQVLDERRIGRIVVDDRNVGHTKLVQALHQLLEARQSVVRNDEDRILAHGP